MSGQFMTEADGALLTKLPTTTGLSRPGISLRITNTTDTDSVVRFTDPVPSGYALASAGTSGVGESGWAALAGGRLEGTVPVGPETTASFTYLLADEYDPSAPVAAERFELLDPEILDVIPVDFAYARRSPALVWRSPAGDSVPMVTCDPAGHPAVCDPTRLDGWLLESGRADPSETVESSETSPESGEVPPEWALAPARSRPVIGVVADGTNADGVLGTVLRANERGFSVFVTASESPDSETARLAERLGAELVAPPADPDPRSFERVLSRAARDAGHPGVVFQPPDCPRIDYERTLAAFEQDGFETTAIPAESSHATDHPRVVVGIPAYNAGRTITAVVEAATPFADLVVVVDDGSADDTAAEARRAGAIVLSHERNRGYGGALKTLFEEGNRRGATHLVTLDADGQHDPADVPKLIEAQERDGTDVVIGSRYASGSATRLPAVRSFGLGVVNLLTNLSMGRFRPRTWVRDTQSGFRAYSKPVLASLAATPEIGNGMWASTDIIYHADAEGFEFAEVGTTIRYDVEDASTQGALSHGTGLVRNIFGEVEHSHPLLSLGLPGVVGALAGVALGSWGLELLLGGELSLVPILAAGLLVVVGVGLLVLSLLFHAMNTHPFYQRR